ncbi:hypothetical protein H4219_005672, partial [Mycoemilia scoparia]
SLIDYDSVGMLSSYYAFLESKKEDLQQDNDNGHGGLESKHTDYVTDKDMSVLGAYLAHINSKIQDLFTNRSNNDTSNTNGETKLDTDFLPTASKDIILDDNILEKPNPYTLHLNTNKLLSILVLITETTEQRIQNKCLELGIPQVLAGRSNNS